MSEFNISKKDLEQELEKKKKALTDAKDAADKLAIAAEIGNIEGQLKAIENGFDDEESRKLFGTVGAMEKRSKFAADYKIGINRDYRDIPVALRDIKAKMWNTIKYDDFNHSNENLLGALKGRLQELVVEKLLDDKGNFRHNKLESYFGDKTLLSGVQAIKLKKPEVEALENELEQKKKELNSVRDPEAQLAKAAEIGYIDGQLRAINNGFGDEASRKLFGTVGAMYERSNRATKLKTDIYHDYSYILGDLRDIKEKMWNTFKYDNYNHSIENLEALKGRLQKKVVNKFLDNGKFIKENMKNYFGDEKLLSGVEGIELKKNNVLSSITSVELDKAASSAQQAGMKGDAYLKYIYLLREWVRRGQAKLVTQHFKGMITTTQLNLDPEEEAKLTSEQKRKRILERQTDNLNFIKKVAEDLATESIRRFDKDVNRRAAAMKRAAECKFDPDKYTVSVDQGNIDIDESKLDPYAISKSVSRQLALRQIYKEHLDNKEPAAYEALEADLKIFDSMKAVQSSSKAETAIMDELNAGIELHRSRMKTRIDRVKAVYENKQDNLVIAKRNNEVEYVAPEADTRKTSRFSQIKDFTAFFTVKHNMVENAQNFLEQIAATTDKPTVFSAHSNEYREMYQSLRDVARLPDKASPVQVYRAIEKLRDKADWYHAVMEPKMHLSNGAKRVEISANIKNICDSQLQELEQAIDMESSEFKTDLANAEYMEFKDPQKSKKDGLLDVKKENKEELKEQLKKRSRDMIYKTMVSIKDTLDRVTKHANSDKQPKEFKAMYKGVSALMNVTAPINDKDDQNAFDETITERLATLEMAAKAYIATNKSFLNSDNERVRVQTAIDLAGFCKRTISYLGLSRTLGNAPEKDKSWDDTDVKAKAGKKNYDPTESFGDPGWVTNASNAAGKYLGALETIMTRANTLFEELHATLEGGSLEGRSEHFRKMYSALQTVRDIDIKNKSHTEIAKDVEALQKAAEKYKNMRNSGWHLSAGKKRLAVSEAILALNIQGFEKLDEDLEASGCAMMDDTPADIQNNIFEMDKVNRNMNPENELVKLRAALNDRDTGLKVELSDANNKNDSNKIKVALKKCFENNNDTKIQKAKLNKRTLFGVREEYPQEAMDYMIDNGMFGEMYKTKVKIEGSDKNDKSRKNDGRKKDHTAEIKKLKAEITKLEQEHNTIELTYMSEFYEHATEYSRLKRQYENKSEGYKEALEIFGKESKAKQDEMKTRDKEAPIAEEEFNQEWKAHQKPKLAELDNYEKELQQLEARLKELENVKSKKAFDDSKKRLEAKNKELKNLESEQVDPELVNIEPLMLLVHTKGVIYEDQKNLYKESVKALADAKGAKDSDFVDKLSNVLDKGYALRYQMFGVGLWTPQQQNEEKKMLEDAKKNLKDNWESISIAYSKDKIIKMVSESKDAAEFSRIAARFDPERLDCSKFLEDKKFGNEPLAVEGQLNEKALNSYREDLRVGVYNNMKKLQELKKNTNPENKTKNCKEMETCVNNMLDFSAALLAVNEMKKRFRAITRWDKKVTIQSVINTNLKLRDLNGDEIEESYFKYIRNSETFRQMALQCDKEAKEAQKAQKSDDPFASVNILTEKILHDDPNDLENFIKNVNRRANSGDRFLDPSDPDKALIISIDPKNKNLRLDISEPRPQAVKEINPNLPKKEKKKVIEKLEIRKQKLEKSAYGSYFKAGTDFGNYETHANIKSDQREEEFLDQMIDILCQKGRLYDTIKEIRILKANSKKTSSITYTNEDMDLEYKSTRDALRKISRAMKPEDALKCCHDGSIIEQIRIVKHEMPIHLDATYSSNPADTPLNKMDQDERDKRVNLTKQILSARCERIANYLDSIAMTLEENQAAKDENKKPKFNDREYESLVKEAVQNLAALAAIKIREFQMKKGKDFLKGEESTLDRMFNGGIREVVDENNKNAEPRLSSKCGLTQDFMRKYFFRQMMADCKTSVPGDTNGLKGLAELLHSAGQENDLVAERHKTIEKLNEKLGEKFGEKLGGTRRNSFNSYIKNAIDNFKKLRKDDVLNSKTPADEPVRDANRTFDVAGVRITPRTSEDMTFLGKTYKAVAAKRNEELKMLSKDKSFLELYAVKKCIDPKDEFKTSIIKGVLEAVNAETDAREQLRKEQSNGVSPENIRKCQTTVSDRLDKVKKICDNAIKKLSSKMSGVWGFRTFTYEKEVEALKKLKAHYDKHYNKEKRKELDDKVNRKIDSLREKSDKKSSLFKVAAEMIVCEKIISDPYESNERILDQLDPIAYRAKVDEVMKSEKFLKFTNEAGDDKLRKFIADGKVMENYEAAPVPKKVPVVKEKNDEPAPAPQTVTVVNETNGSVTTPQTVPVVKETNGSVPVTQTVTVVKETNGSVPVTQAVSGVMKNNGPVPVPLKRVVKSIGKSK